MSQMLIFLLSISRCHPRDSWRCDNVRAVLINKLNKDYLSIYKKYDHSFMNISGLINT